MGRKDDAKDGGRWWAASLDVVVLAAVTRSGGDAWKNCVGGRMATRSRRAGIVWMGWDVRRYDEAIFAKTVCWILNRCVDIILLLRVVVEISSRR